jgi:hypothetical protein
MIADAALAPMVLALNVWLVRAGWQIAGRFVADQIAPEARGRSLLAAAEPQPGDQTNPERFL